MSLVLQFRSNFAKEQEAKERQEAFDNRIAELLVEVENPSIDDYLAAMKQAHEDLDPNHGELAYDMEELH